MLLLFAAASFTCLNPSHHDGDNMRCSNVEGSLRLFGIDAPEMPGACRPGRRCTPGDPYAARDYLDSLTRGRDVRCTVVDVDSYGRQVVDCTADGKSISCAMIAGGQAVERYGHPACGGDVMAEAPVPVPDYPGGEPPRPGRVDPPAVDRRMVPEPVVTAPPPAGTRGQSLRADLAYARAWVSERSAPLPLLAGWITLMSALGYVLMTVDKRRALAARHLRVRRIPESTLLLVAAAGGSPGVLAARRQLNHKTLKQPFGRRLIGITGLQIGLALGLAWLALQP